MPRSCSICADPSLRIAVDKLRTDGATLRDIESRIKRPRTTVHNHFRFCENGRAVKRGGGDTPQAKPRGTSVAGRCPTCGLVSDGNDAQGLLRRAERMIAVGETIMLSAQSDGDLRLSLQALDRVKSSVELAMKAHGLIGGDSVNVTVNAQKQAKMTLEEALTTILSHIHGEATKRTLVDWLRGEIDELPKRQALTGEIDHDS